MNKIILGIDPGLATTGYGVIKKEGSRVCLIDYGVIKTPAKTIHAKRLKKIYNNLKKIIEKHKPDLLAVEELFFCKNVKTALQVSQARGVILLLGNQMKITIEEFTPLEVKQAVSSYGRADKNQVQQMTKRILNLKEIPRPDDAADALACAICGAFSYKF
jgi:crossover junction endodeoxyribonuclease RuvC